LWGSLHLLGKVAHIRDFKGGALGHGDFEIAVDVGGGSGLVLRAEHGCSYQGLVVCLGKHRSMHSDVLCLRRYCGEE